MTNPEPSKTNNTKQTRVQKKAVVTKPVVRKNVTTSQTAKKSVIGDKAKKLFLGDDIKTAFGYVVTETLMPAIRNLMVDGSIRLVERITYGERTPPNRSNIGAGGTRISYDSIGRSTANRSSNSYPANRPTQPMARRTQRFGEIILQSESDANAVLEQMREVLEQFPCVTVADLCDLIGEPSVNYTDNNYGWTDLGIVRIIQTRDGWALDLPPAVPVAQ